MYKVGCIMVGIALFLPLWALAQPNPSSAARMLAAMRDKSRPLLVFSPHGEGDRPLEASIAKQRQMFHGHEAELEERDVLLIYVPDVSSHESGDPGKWSDLRKQFHIEDCRFAVVLLGKDGGEKFRSHEPVTIEKLIALIDAMPMRQQEVRDGHHTK